MHSNPGRAAEIGKRGGIRSHGPLLDDNHADIPAPTTNEEARKVIAEVIGRMLRGQMKPQLATAIVNLCQAFARLTDISDLERRMVELEEALKRAAELPRPNIVVNYPTPEECDKIVAGWYADTPVGKQFED